MEQISQLAIGVSGFNERVDGTPLRTADWTDVAARLAKCSRVQASLVRAIYLHEVKAMRYVVDTLAAGKARVKASPVLSRDIAYVALKAFLSMRPCEFCEGEGRVRMPPNMWLDAETGKWHEIKGGWKQCSWCAGDGYTHVKQDAVRDMMEVSPQVWDMLVAQPFTESYEQLREWHKTAGQIITTGQ